MAHRKIAVGETSSHRYIGIEPPISDEIADRILKIVAMPEWIIWGMDYHTETVGENPPYTEFGADVGDALDTIGRDAVNEGAMKLARAIGSILEAEGDSIEIKEPMITTDFDHPLFGPDADQEREILMSIRARRQVQEL